MDSETEGKLVHKAEMQEMDYLRSLGMDPNFADLSRHMEKVLEPFIEQEDLQDEIDSLEYDNEELSCQVSDLEDRMESLCTYARRLRRELDKMDFEGKGEIEAILEDIEGELEL
jgi:predicted  nucleic acid-binding Zn-ribbon protein